MLTICCALFAWYVISFAVVAAVLRFHQQSLDTPNRFVLAMLTVVCLPIMVTSFAVTYPVSWAAYVAGVACYYFCNAFQEVATAFSNGRAAGR